MEVTFSNANSQRSTTAKAEVTANFEQPIGSGNGVAMLESGIQSAARSSISESDGSFVSPNAEFSVESTTEVTGVFVVNCFKPCPQNCGGGYTKCRNTCANGVFGVDAECPIEEEFELNFCNTQECRKFFYIIIFHETQILTIKKFLRTPLGI